MLMARDFEIQLEREGESSLVFGIGEIAVKGSVVIGNAAINFDMEAFGFASTGCSKGEGFIELRKVSGFDSDMEFSEGGKSESEFAAGYAVAFNFPVVFHMTEPGVDGVCELKVFCAAREVGPDFVEIHAARLPFVRWVWFDSGRYHLNRT